MAALIWFDFMPGLFLKYTECTFLPSTVFFWFSFQVVFHKMSPNETLFLESTNKIYKDDISSSSFVNFQIWDFPGQVDFFDPTFDYEMIFRGTGALIFVIDAQVRRRRNFTRIHFWVVSCNIMSWGQERLGFNRTTANTVCTFSCYRYTG